MTVLGKKHMIVLKVLQIPPCEQNILELAGGSYVFLETPLDLLMEEIITLLLSFNLCFKLQSSPTDSGNDSHV